jgi:hypothetical protein
VALQHAPGGIANDQGVGVFDGFGADGCFGIVHHAFRVAVGVGELFILFPAVEAIETG